LLNNFNLNIIQHGVLSIPDNEFLEVFINDLRNAIISYQTFILDIRKEVRNKLIKKIKQHKSEPNLQITVIAELENELRSMDENELNFVCEKNSLFEIIHTERITPFFLKVIKGNVSLSSQNSIKGAGGGNLSQTIQTEKNILESILQKFIERIQTNRKI
jgi:hypothetical protein